MFAITCGHVFHIGSKIMVHARQKSFQKFGFMVQQYLHKCTYLCNKIKFTSHGTHFKKLLRQNCFGLASSHGWLKDKTNKKKTSAFEDHVVHGQMQ